MDIISNLNGVSKSSNDGPELVWGQIGGGCEDVLHRGGRESKAPGVDGGESNFCNALSDFANLKESCSPRLRWPGKWSLFCSGDVMCIGMGKGAGDVSVAGDPLLDKPMVDIVDGHQV